MTIEQVKEEAKKRFDKDLTDEQAQALLEAHPAGELQDEELADVAGGGCGNSGGSGDEAKIYIWKNSEQMGPCPRCGCNEHFLPSMPTANNPLYLCNGCKLRYLRVEKRWANEYGR